MPPSAPPQEAIQQVLLALLGNAVQFAFGGKMLVSGKQLQTPLKVEIHQQADGGFGVQVADAAPQGNIVVASRIPE